MDKQRDDFIKIARYKLFLIYFFFYYAGEKMKVFKIKYLKLAFKVCRKLCETDDELKLVDKQRNSFMKKNKMYISMTLKERKKNGTKYHFHIFLLFLYFCQFLLI